MNTNQLYKETSHGTYGAFEIEILVGATILPDLGQSAIYSAAYDAVKLIKSAVMAAVIAADPEAQERSAEERFELISCFTDAIFVEEIPNGYCSDWCCRHLPWFIVTTQIGRFKIGCRKRVIHLEWSECPGTKTAKEIFPDEDVTKDGRMIHAWGIKDARRYVNEVFRSMADPLIPELV